MQLLSSVVQGKGPLCTTTYMYTRTELQLHSCRWERLLPSCCTVSVCESLHLVLHRLLGVDRRANLGVVDDLSNSTCTAKAVSH